MINKYDQQHQLKDAFLCLFSYCQEELLAVLTMMVGANISHEQLLSIAERTILEADQDNDDLISFEEFARVLERTDVEQKMSIRFLN